MRRWFRLIAITILATATLLDIASGDAESHPHVYLFRGLADVFSTGMDTLADELNKQGVHATSHSHTDWKEIADKAAADYKAKKESPIILIGHSLGADAAMEMADYLGDKGVPVALVVPFDGTRSFPVPGNVARVINFTQRDYAYMRPGAGFHGSLNNVDLTSNHDIGHLNIDKLPELHARVLTEVLTVLGRRLASQTVRGRGAARKCRSRLQRQGKAGSKLRRNRSMRRKGTEFTPNPTSGGRSSALGHKRAS